VSEKPKASGRARTKRAKAAPGRTRRPAATDLKRALEASDARFRNIIDKSADGVVVVRMDGTISFVNPATETLLNRTADQLVGEPFGVPTVPGETTEIDLLHGNLAVRVAQMRVVETEWDGEASYLALLRDFTDHKRAVDAFRFLIHASDALGSSLDVGDLVSRIGHLATSHLADWCLIDLVVDGETIDRTVIVRDARPHELPLAVLQGKYPAPADAPFGLAKVLASGEPEVLSEATESVLASLALAPDQEPALKQLGCRSVIIVPLMARGRPLAAITLVSKRPGRVYTSETLDLAIELARRGGLALENARLYNESQEAVRRRDEFLAMLSHELRNPLASIVNAAKVIQLLASHSSSICDARDTIERQGKHMTRLLDDLLDLSRITRGKIELRRRPVCIATLVAEAVEACRPSIDAGRHELIVSLSDEKLRALADPTRLGQVFSNLLSNAAKYTPAGGRIWITAGRLGDECVVRVRDNGIGIAPEVLTHIFDPFFQSDRSLDRSGGGLGVGLTLVKRLVELHGGTVRAASAGLGHGSEFEVRLPLTNESPSANPSGRGPVASRRRIVVVEDNTDNRRMLHSLLELSGHEVTAASDGRTGLEMIRAIQPEIALVDIGLPVMDGHEVVRRIRTLPECDQVLLVALTGYGRPEDRQRALEAGFDAHLVKPVDFDELNDFLAFGARGVRQAAATRFTSKT
jgi:PAS domain S-box-containing protein